MKRPRTNQKQYIGEVQSIMDRAVKSHKHSMTVQLEAINACRLFHGVTFPQRVAPKYCWTLQVC